MNFERDGHLVLAAILCLLLLPGSALAVGHVTKDGKPPYAPYFPYVHRTNLVVADIDRSLKIYRDILGFEVAFKVPIRSAGIVHETFGLDDAVKARIAMLSMGPKDELGNVTRPIGLSEVPGYEPPERNIYDMAFIVEIDPEDDMQELYERLSAEGLEMGEMMDLPIPKRTEFPFTDYDGHRIIVMQLPLVE